MTRLLTLVLSAALLTPQPTWAHETQSHPADVLENQIKQLRQLQQEFDTQEELGDIPYRGSADSLKRQEILDRVSQLVSQMTPGLQRMMKVEGIYVAEDSPRHRQRYKNFISTSSILFLSIWTVILSGQRYAADHHLELLRFVLNNYNIASLFSFVFTSMYFMGSRKDKTFADVPWPHRVGMLPIKWKFELARMFLRFVGAYPEFTRKSVGWRQRRRMVQQLQKAGWLKKGQESQFLGWWNEIVRQIQAGNKEQVCAELLLGKKNQRRRIVLDAPNLPTVPEDEATDQDIAQPESRFLKRGL